MNYTSRWNACNSTPEPDKMSKIYTNRIILLLFSLERKNNNGKMDPPPPTAVPPSLFTSCHTTAVRRIWRHTTPPAPPHASLGTVRVRAPCLVCYIEQGYLLCLVLIWGRRRPLGPTLIIRGEFARAHVWVVLITHDAQNPRSPLFFFSTHLSMHGVCC